MAGWSWDSANDLTAKAVSERGFQPLSLLLVDGHSCARRSLHSALQAGNDAAMYTRKFQNPCRGSRMHIAKLSAKIGLSGW